MSNTESGSGFMLLVFRVLLAVGLIGALVFAGWRIYRRLPAEARIRLFSPRAVRAVAAAGGAEQDRGSYSTFSA